METWSLNHPEYGLIEVRVGFDRDFAAEDASWPGEGADKPGTLATAESSFKERIQLWSKNPTERMEVRVDGAVQHRYNDVNSTRLPLFGDGPKDELETPMLVGLDRSKPHLKLRVSGLDELLSVEFREGDTVVEFDPPAGSRGAHRRETMESSELKRTLIPMAEGLGKGGWALAVLLLGPILSRFLKWLLGFLPDWDLPDLPDWQLPHMNLPVPELPELNLPLPDINWPDLDLPEVPEWVLWLLEYTRIWLPVVIGIVAGVVVLRNHKRSEREKAAWRNHQAEGKTETD